MDPDKYRQLRRLLRKVRQETSTPYYIFGTAVFHLLGMWDLPDDVDVIVSPEYPRPRLLGDLERLCNKLNLDLEIEHENLYALTGEFTLHLNHKEGEPSYYNKVWCAGIGTEYGRLATMYDCIGEKKATGRAKDTYHILKLQSMIDQIKPIKEGTWREQQAVT